MAAADSFALLAALVIVPACWTGIVRRRREMGKSSSVAHIVAGASSPMVLLAVFALFSDPGLYSLIFSAIVAVPLWLFVRPSRPTLPAAVEAAVSISPAASPPPIVDLEAIEATRQQSLVALRLATAARAADKAKESPPEDPLANWKRTAQVEDSSPAVTRKTRRKAPMRGNKLDVVRFDYLNSEGEFSTRRVAVRLIAEEYFSGIDTELLETRTFRYDRLIGSLVSEVSGEFIEPSTWAESLQWRAKTQ